MRSKRSQNSKNESSTRLDDLEKNHYLEKDNIYLKLSNKR